MRLSYPLLMRRVGVLAVALVGTLAFVAPAMSVAHAQATITTSTSVTAPPTVPAGTPVKLTATVICTGATTGPTGSVNFFDTAVTPITFLGAGTLAGGPGTATTSVTTSFSAPPNTHTVTAVYSGDAQCLPSLGTITVNVTATTVAVTGTPNPATQLQPVTFTAVVTCTGDGDPTGSVTFTDITTGTVLLGIDAVGTAGPGTDQRTFTIAPVTFPQVPAAHTIQAVYTSTNPACAGATGTTVENIIPLPTSTTTAFASPNPTTVGTPTTLSATITCASPGTPQGGNVSFFDGANLLGTVPVTTGSPATVNFITTFATTGTHPIEVVFSGTPTCAASFATVNVLVNQVQNGSTTTVSANPATPGAGQPVILTATVTCQALGASPVGGTVTFTDTTTNTPLGTATVGAGGTASINVPGGFTTGLHNISAVFSGTLNCLGSTGTLALNVVPSQVISGVVFDNVNVTGPTTITPGTLIFGNVAISGSGSLTATGALINGTLTATGGTGLRLCGSTVNGQTNITGVNGVIVIGDQTGSPACAGNNLNGAVTISNNTGFLKFSDNSVIGPVTVTNNTTNVTATELAANQINGSLACTGNVPPPTNNGRANQVFGGTKTGQCAAL